MEVGAEIEDTNIDNAYMPESQLGLWTKIKIKIISACGSDYMPVGMFYLLVSY